MKKQRQFWISYRVKTVKERLLRFYSKVHLWNKRWIAATRIIFHKSPPETPAEPLRAKNTNLGTGSVDSSAILTELDERIRTTVSQIVEEKLEKFAQKISERDEKIYQASHFSKAIPQIQPDQNLGNLQKDEKRVEFFF